jgi:glycerophosphoryl diester phosphodiesterase
VLAWTVNDDAELGRVLRAGVDGVVTDDPKTVLATLTSL